MEQDERTFPTWVVNWRYPTTNYGLTGGILYPPHYERDKEILDLEVHLMLSDLESHANWGV